MLHYHEFSTGLLYLHTTFCSTLTVTLHLSVVSVCYSCESNLSLLDIGIIHCCCRHCYVIVLRGGLKDIHINCAMAYYSSDEHEDFFTSFFRPRFPFFDSSSIADVIVRSCGDPERLQRWEKIGPIFHVLR